MNVIIDTSSLRALVNYYLPFDKTGALKGLLKENFIKGKLIIIDKVVSELRPQGGGRFYDNLEFIHKESSDSEYITKTDTLLPYPRFIRRVDDHFCHKQEIISREIDRDQYEVLRNIFLETADCKIVLFAEKFLKQNNGLLLPETITVVSEESTANNDGKLFKKMPVICKQMNIDCCTLPELLKEHYKLNLSEFLN